MANTNTPYIAKNAAPLVNPTTASPFLIAPSPISTVAATQPSRPAYVAYKGYAQGPAGTSNNINYIKVAVRAGGRVMAGGATTFVPSLAVAPASQVAPTLASVATAQTLCALTAANYTANATGIWTLDATLIWSFDTGTVTGTFNGNQLVAGGAPVITAAAAVTPATGYTVTPPLAALPTSQAQALAQASATGEQPLCFIALGVFGTGAATNMAYLDDFEVEVL